MKKRIRFCIVLLMFAVAAAIWADAESGRGTWTVTVSGTGQEEGEITEVPYRQDGYDAVYPNIISGGSLKQLEQWNKLIDQDFEKILHIYSFQPFPQPTPPTGSSAPVILKLGYTIKENSDRLISIFYTADFASPYSAHPTELIYTTNIDKIGSRRVRLGDYVKLNEKFVKEFRTWEPILYEEGEEELNKAARDYMASFTDKELLRGFRAADQIGSANLYHIYSYRTPEKLGISLEAPNYLGDHIEFEKKLSELSDYLK